jgi:hypothetical protein
MEHKIALGSISWYSITADVNVKDNGAVDLNGALKIVDEYMFRAGKVYEYAEDAVAETMFGFSRSESEFIEICVDGVNQISYKFEYAEPSGSWFTRFFGGVYQYEEELDSKEKLIEKVTNFFTKTPQEIKEGYKGRLRIKVC